MLPIYLCEDSPEQLALLADIVQKAILMEELDMEIVCQAPTSQELLDHLACHEKPALYFLDINLAGKIEGFQLAQTIREQDPRGFIVFITTHSELSQLAFEYQVEAMDYIAKDDPERLSLRIKGCMLKAKDLFSSSGSTPQKMVKFKIGGKLFLMKVDDIYSVETFGEPHRIRIYEKSGYSDFFYTLSDIGTVLDDDFYQCHKSCIINLHHIKEISRQEHSVVLDNGRICPVSSRCLTTLCKKSCSN